MVKNPSFELHIACPSSFGDLNKCVDWETPNSIYSTPDYYNVCNGQGSFSIPMNNNGYGFQFAHSGGAYVGILCLQSFADRREYLVSKLVEPLKKGNTYYLTYYVSLCELSQYSISSMGASFFVSDSFSFNNYMLIGEPQIENPINIKLDDTLSWQKISGYINAEGGEKYVTIGNFRNDISSGRSVTGFGVTSASYYYIDDVCVSLNPADCGIDTTGMYLGVDGEGKEPIHIYPNPTQDELYIQSEAHLLSYYTIADIAGNVVQQGDIAGNKISVADLAKGVYFVRLQGRDG